MNWLKKQMLGLSLALSKVESNALHNTDKTLSDDTKTIQKHNQGTLADDLMKGILSEEVKLLRARLYKVDEASAEFTTDKAGNKIFKTFTIPETVKGEPSDDYPVTVVFKNNPITKGLLDDDFDPKNPKTEKPLELEYHSVPKFNIREYTTKVYVKHFDTTEVIIELFITKYPDPYDKRKGFLISALKKSLSNRIYTDFKGLIELSFISDDNTLGSRPNRSFKYDNLSFYKLTEHDDSYVLKYKGKAVHENFNIMSQYAMDKLDKGYENKEVRDNKSRDTIGALPTNEEDFNYPDKEEEIEFEYNDEETTTTHG